MQGHVTTNEIETEVKQQTKKQNNIEDNKKNEKTKQRIEPKSNKKIRKTNGQMVIQSQIQEHINPNENIRKLADIAAYEQAYKYFDTQILFIPEPWNSLEQRSLGQTRFLSSKQTYLFIIHHINVF